MHVLCMQSQTEPLPKEIGVDELGNLVTAAIESHSIPASIDLCEIFECPVSELETRYTPKYWLFGAPTARHRHVHRTERQGRIELLYFPNPRLLEDAFADLVAIESETHLQFHRGGYYSSNAIIPEISPIMRCGLYNNYVTVDGYASEKPSDYTTISVRLWGQVPSTEARRALTEIADAVSEPTLERDGRFSTSYPYGGQMRGSTPEVVIAKRWNGFDRNAVATFVERTCTIDREHAITDWSLLEHDHLRSLASRYPMHQIEIWRYGNQQDGEGRWPLYGIGFSFPFIGKRHKRIAM